MLNYAPTPSYVVIGGDADPNDTSGDVFDLKLMQSDNLWWSTAYNGLTFGGTDIQKSPVNIAILDTGTSLIALPDDDYNAFVSKLLSYSFVPWDCSIMSNCIVGAPCSSVNAFMAGINLEI